MRTLVSRLIVVALAIPCVECAMSGKGGSAAVAAPEAPAPVSPPAGATRTPAVSPVAPASFRDPATVRREHRLALMCASVTPNGFLKRGSGGQDHHG
jgi:hypothetical protein